MAPGCDGRDCDDDSNWINPGVPEECNRRDDGTAVDDDCDGVVDNFTEACFPDMGECVAGLRTCTAGYWLECVGGVGPTKELCDGLDNDCDGEVDNVIATEICNGIDDDCDGESDENWPALGTLCDGSDDDLCEEGMIACNATGSGTMCADTTMNNVEICNGADDDCDDVTDEGCSSCVEIRDCVDDCAPEDGACQEACFNLGCSEAQMTFLAMIACINDVKASGGVCDAACGSMGGEAQCDACLTMNCGTEISACEMQTC
jgi:hypothetical protein